MPHQKKNKVTTHRRACHCAFAKSLVALGVAVTLTPEHAAAATCNLHAALSRGINLRRLKLGGRGCAFGQEETLPYCAKLMRACSDYCYHGGFKHTDTLLGKEVGQS